MDKKIAAQGIIKVQKKNDKKLFHHLKSVSKNKDNESFEIDRNEFPSLNEISERVGSHGKNPLDYNKSFSYSEKLKQAPTESKPCLKFEDTVDVPKISPALAKEFSSVKNKTSFKNSMPRSTKSHSDHISSECPSDVSQVSHQENFGISNTKSSNHSHGMNKVKRNVSFTDAQINAKSRDDGYGSKARNQNQVFESPKMSRKPKSATAEHHALNKTGSFKPGGSLVNAESSPIKKSDGSAQSFQNSISRNDRNSFKLQSNYKGESSHQVDSYPTEVKAKKKRKSKVKRQAALQTGKILVLTPEAHSRIFNQSNITNFKQNQGVVANINDSEEYPELGTASVSKNNKENVVKQVDITTKDSLIVSDKTELEIVKLESDLVTPQPISVIQEAHQAVVKSDGEKNVKASDTEKPPVLKKDPITMSLFDMLLTAKSKKKEIEKKIELADQESSFKNVKPSSKVLGKKGVSYGVNPLDSSRPAIKRGKERENPKAKKPSRMRKLILMGRQLRKKEMATNDEIENTAIHSDDCQSSSELTDIIKDVFIHYTENILLRDSDSKASSLEVEDSEIPFPENESLGAPKSTDTNYSLHFSNDSRAETSLAELVELKTSDINTTNDSANLKELKENESSDKDLCASSQDFCSPELVINHLKDFEDQTFKTTKSHDCIYDDVKCVLNDILIYAKKENQVFDFEMGRNESDFVQKKITLDQQPCLENNKLLNNCNLATCESFLEGNITDDGSSKLEESSDTNISNATQKVNINNFSKFPVGSVLKMESNISSTPVNCEDISSFATNSSHSEESFSDSLLPGKKELSSDLSEGYIDSEEIKQNNSIRLESDLNGNASCLDPSNKESEISKNLTSDEEKAEAVKTMIHSRKFRKYCNHFISKEIDTAVFALLDDLARFQDRMHQKDPVKARVRKRLLYGIKEIKRHMKLKKLKGIILATNIEDIKTEGGLNDVIDEIISLAEAYHIPYIFSHRRFNLGKVCRKGVPVSCVGIFNYEGSEKNFKRILELQEESKHDYLTASQALEGVLSHNQITDLLKLEKGVPEKLYEMRAKILRENFMPDTNQSEIEASEVSSSSDNVDVKESNALVCQKSNVFTEGDTFTPQEIKNKIYIILRKYSIL